MSEITTKIETQSLTSSEKKLSTTTDVRNLRNDYKLEEDKFFYYDKLMENFNKTHAGSTNLLEKEVETPKKLNHEETMKYLFGEKHSDETFQSKQAQQNQAEKTREASNVDSFIQPEMQVIKQNELQIDNEEIKTEKSKPKQKFTRLKFFAIVMVICVVCGSGLFISNMVKINKLKTSINKMESEYNVNVYKYIKNINKLDKLDDYVKTNETVDNTSFVPIKLSKQELATLAETDKVKTNWYDSLMTKIQNFFGNK